MIEVKPIGYRLQMKLVQIMPPPSVKGFNHPRRETIWCGKPIQLEDLNKEITAMLPRFVEKVMAKVKK